MHPMDHFPGGEAFCDVQCLAALYIDWRILNVSGRANTLYPVTSTSYSFRRWYNTSVICAVSSTFTIFSYFAQRPISPRASSFDSMPGWINFPLTAYHPRIYYPFDYRKAQYVYWVPLRRATRTSRSTYVAVGNRVVAAIERGGEVWCVSYRSTTTASNSSKYLAEVCIWGSWRLLLTSVDPDHFTASCAGACFPNQLNFVWG